MWWSADSLDQMMNATMKRSRSPFAPCDIVFPEHSVSSCLDFLSLTNEQRDFCHMTILVRRDLLVWIWTIVTLCSPIQTKANKLQGWKRPKSPTTIPHSQLTTASLINLHRESFQIVTRKAWNFHDRSQGRDTVCVFACVLVTSTWLIL